MPQTLVRGVRGVWREKKSPWPRASSRLTRRNPMAAAVALETRGSLKAAAAAFRKNGSHLCLRCERGVQGEEVSLAKSIIQAD